MNARCGMKIGAAFIIDALMTGKALFTGFKYDILYLGRKGIG